MDSRKISHGKTISTTKENPSKARQLNKKKKNNNTSSTSDLPSIGASLSSEADVVARDALHQHPGTFNPHRRSFLKTSQPHHRLPDLSSEALDLTRVDSQCLDSYLYFFFLSVLCKYLTTL